MPKTVFPHSVGQINIDVWEIFIIFFSLDSRNKTPRLLLALEPSDVYNDFQVWNTIPAGDLLWDSLPSEENWSALWH